jgi:hypothetical protein
MATLSTEDPQFQRAIQACTVALRRMAHYELAPSLHRCMQALGERKEFLSGPFPKLCYPPSHYSVEGGSWHSRCAR